MGLAQLQNALNQIDKEIVSLEKKLAEITKNEYTKAKRINDIERSINKNTSFNTYNSKKGQIQIYQKDVANIISKKADINKKIANNRKKRNDLTIQIQKAEQRLQKQTMSNRLKLEKTYEKQISSLTEKFNIANSSRQTNSDTIYTTDTDEIYDVFISHATEDKESFVGEFVNILKNDLDLKVWYDDISLTWGDSIRAKIDQGLKKCKFGVVVLSRSYIKKHWTQYELEGLFQRESSGGKLILPIWHDITKKEIQDFSPTIAGRKAMNTTNMTTQEIAKELQTLLTSSVD